MPPSAKPLCLVLALAYLAGAPVLDGLRPAAVDEPLQRFHEGMTLVAGDGARAARQVAMGERQVLLADRLFANVSRSLAAAR